MVANATSERQRFLVNPALGYGERRMPVSLPTGTTAAMIALDGDWREIPTIDLNSGHYTVFASGSEFLAAMDEMIARNEARNR